MENKLNSVFNSHFSALICTYFESKMLSSDPSLAFNQSLLFNELIDIKKPRFIVALSGGVDSVVLLHLLVCFRSLNKNIEVFAHNVNHGLSDNAGDWAIFCADICQKLNVTLLRSSVSIERKARVSLEAAAREARYQCFKEKMDVGDVILTGHHQDDQLETVLLALKRGSGSTGLQGIHAYQAFFDGHLLRPLLGFSRQELVDYAVSNQLKWIEDESNQDIEFDRNFIRQKISPLLKQRWPAIAKSATRTAQLCQEQQCLLNEVAEDDLKRCLSRQNLSSGLSIVLLSELSDARRNNVIRYWLKRHGLQYPSRKQLDVLWEEVALAEVDKQPMLQLETNSVRRYQQLLYVVSTQQIKLPEKSMVWSGESTLIMLEGKLEVDFSKVDKTIAEQYKIECCLRQHLDAALHCQPIGRNKARSVKKLLHEYQVPPWLREQVVFILIDGQLAEAVGIWQCELKDKPTLNLSCLVF